MDDLTRRRLVRDLPRAIDFVTNRALDPNLSRDERDELEYILDQLSLISSDGWPDDTPQDVRDGYRTLRDYLKSQLDDKAH